MTVPFFASGSICSGRYDAHPPSSPPTSNTTQTIAFFMGGSVSAHGEAHQCRMAMQTSRRPFFCGADAPVGFWNRKSRRGRRHHHWSTGPAFTEFAQVDEGVIAAGVAIDPVDAQGVISHELGAGGGDRA